jgi:hypothetical protein
VIPPSIHPDTGQPYVWLTKPNGAFPEPPHWLVQLWTHIADLKAQLVGVCPWAPKLPERIKKPAYASGANTSVIDTFNAQHSIEIELTRFGYVRQGKRWLSPHSTTQLPGVSVFEDNRCWIHHGSDPLCSAASGHPVGPFDLVLHYEFGGDIRKAVRELADRMGLKNVAHVSSPRTITRSDVANVSDVADGSTVLAEDWFTGPPMDIFREAPVPDIHADMLPRIIAEYAFDQADLLGVAPEMIAMPAIVACAAVIHDGIEVQPKRYETGWRESARLWCAVVGSPSVRKSPSLKRSTSRLRKINVELGERNRRKQADYDRQVEDWKEAKRQAKTNKEPPPPAPEEPPKERLIVEDVTVEALSEILKHNERGVLCIQDELSGWFGSMDAYTGNKGSNKDRAHWLEIYNGGHRVVDRVVRGSIIIPNWSACMVGGIQPDMIRRVAQNMGDDGLMQRFMIIMGRNLANESDRPNDEAANTAYHALIDKLYAIQPGAGVVTLSEEAHVIRERLFDYAREMGDYEAMPNGLRSHLGKWTGLFSRLALTYHVIECAGKSVHPYSIPISGDTAEQVERLMRKFLLPHALAYYTDVLGQESHLEHARWIAGHLLSKQVARIEQREIVQAYKAWRGLNEWTRARVMSTLQDLGWVYPVAGQGFSKKLPTAWDVNPLGHQAFEARAEAERKKRAELRSRMVELGRVEDVVQK